MSSWSNGKIANIRHSYHSSISKWECGNGGETERGAKRFRMSANVHLIHFQILLLSSSHHVSSSSIQVTFSPTGFLYLLCTHLYIYWNDFSRLIIKFFFFNYLHILIIKLFAMQLQFRNLLFLCYFFSNSIWNRAEGKNFILR